jgi:hypothetical protein
MDGCSQWYIEKRSHLIRFWLAANVLLVGAASYLNWKFGIAWIVVAILGFIVSEKLLLRGV